MKRFATAFLVITLAGCGTSGDDPQSEAMIANAATTLEKQADANVNRMIAEIEATSEATPELAPVAEPGAKAGIEKQGKDDN